MKMNQCNKRFAYKEKTGMEQDIHNKAEKVNREPKQKGKIVLKWALTLTYLVLLIYFVFKPLTDFVAMIDYSIKSGIIKFFIN